MISHILIILGLIIKKVYNSKKNFSKY
jgi:hypothetical protein